jgi:cell division protein FtsW (lipid II flippase)
MTELLDKMNDFLNFISKDIIGTGRLIMQFDTALGIYSLIMHLLLPFFAVLILLRSILPLLQGREQNAVWGYLGMKDGTKLPLNHWENSIGRNKFCDIVIKLSFVSRNHAVLTFCGSDWFVADLGSKGGVAVNGKKVEGQARLNTGDTLSVAGVEMVLLPPGIGDKNVSKQAAPGRFTRYCADLKSGITLLLILIFQLAGCIQIWFSPGSELNPAIPVTFILFAVIEILFYFIMRWNRKHFELELLCCFLSGLSLFIVASAAPGSLYKQLISIFTGIIGYTVLGILLRNFKSARRLKYILAAAALMLIALTLTIGETRFGAKNWINLGVITFQPFEFIKVAFVMAGAATLDKLLTTRNLTAFMIFSGACIGALVLMRDLGTAVIFFGTFLVIAFMRSGDVKTILIISGGAVLGAIAVIAIMPYIASRFEAWGHVWEYANSTGYQQTRTMIAAASGGLLGLGGGNGFLVNIAAADTDLVFGILCEEWGLIIALITVLTIVFFAVFAMSMTKNSRSALYSIAACGAASIFLIQTALNVFGSVDILPLTGVTMPFVSNGGSSMIASWGLMAFIKSADARIKSGKSGKVRNGEKL